MTRLLLAAIALACAAVAPAAGRPTRIALTSVTVTEGQVAKPVLSKSGGNGRPVSVTWRTSDGRSGTVSVSAPVALSITTKDDTLVNGTRTLGLSATASTGATASAPITVLDNDVASAPTPTPVPTPIPEPTPVPGTFTPTPTVGPVPTIPSNFDVNTELVDLGAGGIPGSAAPDTEGAFRFLCMPGQIRRDDPIVYPNQPGRSHLHQFFGNLEANASSTYESLRKSGQSTCMSPVNRSAYWMPALLDGLGNVVNPDTVAIYYKRFPKSSPYCTTLADVCEPLPNGLRFIFGRNITNLSEPPAETDKAWFMCDASAVDSSKSIAATHSMDAALNTCPVGARFIVQLEAPGCWNGKDLDSLNHRDHVRQGVFNPYQSRWECPAGNRHQLPQFLLGPSYKIAAGDNTAGWHFSSDEMAPNEPRGSTFHADWFGAWDPTVQAMWEDNCLDKLLNCSSGILGNGKIIKAYPGFGQPVPHLVPVP